MGIAKKNHPWLLCLFQIIVIWPSDTLRPYTLGAPLRILHVKNVAMIFAPERLRIFPHVTWGDTPTTTWLQYVDPQPAYSTAHAPEHREIFLKISPHESAHVTRTGALSAVFSHKRGKFHARTKDNHLDRQSRNFGWLMRKVKNPPKWRTQYLTFWVALEPKNMPMGRPGGLRMWAEVRSLYS